MSTDKRLRPSSAIKWLKVADLKVDRSVQRDESRRWIAERVEAFDVDKLGVIVVSERDDGSLFVVDGQHRVSLVRAVGWGDQVIECELFSGLTRQEEARLFLDRNDRRAVNAFDAFRVRLTAEDEVVADIDRIVRAHGLTVSKDKDEAAVSAVVALERVYSCHGPRDFGRMLTVLRDGFGAHRQSFAAASIEGVGMVVGRFNGDLNDEDLTRTLAALSGGPVGLRVEANRRRVAYGRPWSESTAIALVDLYNKGRKVGKLLPWLKAVAQDEDQAETKARAS
jgi:hypothetical protein